MSVGAVDVFLSKNSTNDPCLWVPKCKSFIYIFYPDTFLFPVLFTTVLCSEKCVLPCWCSQQPSLRQRKHMVVNIHQTSKTHSTAVVVHERCARLPKNTRIENHAEMTHTWQYNMHAWHVWKMAIWTRSRLFVKCPYVHTHVKPIPAAFAHTQHTADLQIGSQRGVEVREVENPTTPLSHTHTHRHL